MFYFICKGKYNFYIFKIYFLFSSLFWREIFYTLKISA